MYGGCYAICKNMHLRTRQPVPRLLNTRLRPCWTLLGDSLVVKPRTLTPVSLVRIQVPQPILTCERILCSLQKPENIVVFEGYSIVAGDCAERRKAENLSLRADILQSL